MKILLVCESSHLYESGGRVVRYITKVLKKQENQLKLVVLSDKRDDYNLDEFYVDNNVDFLPLNKRLYARIFRVFFDTKEVRRFKKNLTTFTPDIIHFASFDNSKPSKFISLAIKSKAKVILQPWTMHFYCSQGFGFRNGEQCTLCAGGNYWNAISNKCVTARAIPSLIEKKNTHKKALKADVFLSSNSPLDSILNSYGVLKQKIHRFPIAFDYTFLKTQSEEKEGDYFIFYGQANEHKGLKVLLEVFAKLPDLRLKIYPMSNLPQDVSKYRNIEIINGVNWKNGLSDAIVNAKAVLMPSLWSTSTEYALCEALLMQKPVVVFNVGVHKDIFKNRENAMVIEPGDINSFTQAVVELSDNKELRNYIGKNGYQTLLEINEPDKLYNEILSAYNR
jgi:glycosyltransferase involved in cell wall biosynthesis